MATWQRSCWLIATSLTFIPQVLVNSNSVFKHSSQKTIWLDQTRLDKERKSSFLIGLSCFKTSTTSGDDILRYQPQQQHLRIINDLPQELLFNILNNFNPKDIALRAAGQMNRIWLAQANRVIRGHINITSGSIFRLQQDLRASPAFKKRINTITLQSSRRRDIQLSEILLNFAEVCENQTLVSQETYSTTTSKH